MAGSLALANCSIVVLERVCTPLESKQMISSWSVHHSGFPVMSLRMCTSRVEMMGLINVLSKPQSPYGSRPTAETWMPALVLSARQLHAHLLHRRGHHVYIGVLAGLAGALQDDATVVHVHHLPLEGHAGGRGEVELLSHEG